MARKTGTPALSVDLPEDVHKALRVYAEAQDLTVSQIVRSLIRNFLKNKK